MLFVGRKRYLRPNISWWIDWGSRFEYCDVISQEIFRESTKELDNMVFRCDETVCRVVYYSHIQLNGSFEVK